MGCQSSVDATNSVLPVNQQLNSQFSNQLKPKELISQTSDLIKNKEFAKAAKVYRNYIEKHIAEDVEIDGMGNWDDALGYYEWFKFKWYWDGIEKGVYKGTVYDCLSLCQLQLKNKEHQIQEAIEWYRAMIDFYPQKHQILYCYANVLYSKTIYDEAIDFYKRVIKLKPIWKMPYICIAFAYQYKRIQLEKANQYAKTILKMEPNNRVAMFILARNQKDVENKLTKLKEASAAYPQYARIINEIGVVYGGVKKDNKQAIEWYKKCIEVAPLYSSCYNNLGVNYQLLKQIDEAIQWYFRAIEKDRDYKAPYANLCDCFKPIYQESVQNKDKSYFNKVDEILARYKIQPDYFYYNLGVAFDNTTRADIALSHYFTAQPKINGLKEEIYKFYNSFGSAYHKVGLFAETISYYNKAIEINPKFHLTYFNMAITYKQMGNIPETINWYKKAIQVNHRYSSAYLNLGNIYKSLQNYEEALKCFKKAVEHLSTDTLAYANMAICYLIIQDYREGFNAIQRVKYLLPTDNNGLSASNKNFLNGILKDFQEQGEKWRQNGGVKTEPSQSFVTLLKSYMSQSKPASQTKVTVNEQKVFRKDISEIIKFALQQNFDLKNIDKIYVHIKSAFQANQEYFHILPQLFVQYFIKQSFSYNKKVHILQTQNEVQDILKKLFDQGQKSTPSVSSNDLQLKLKHFDPPSDKKVDLFGAGKFFSDYAQLNKQILELNTSVLASYKPFKQLVDKITKSSYGKLYGVALKIPNQQKQQFKVMLNILGKLLKDEINSERIKLIISMIQMELKKKQSLKGVPIADIMTEIKAVWTNQITLILKQRKQKGIETKCQLNDLLRGKITFGSLDRLKKALESADDICFQSGYEIISMENKLSDPQAQDVILTIKVKNAICQLELAISQDQTQFQFVQAVNEIQKSPLGCIFGSYIYLNKRIKYPLLKNCQDIVTLLSSEPQKGQKAEILKAAMFIVDALKQK